MNKVVITDIFGDNLLKNNQIYNKLPFLMMHSTQPSLLLNKISNSYDSIWKICLPSLNNILHYYDINPQYFSILGDIWFPYIDLPDTVTILLTNIDNNLSSYPIDFIKIDTYVNTNIWKPICPNGFTGLGLITEINKPSLKSLKIINNNFITKYIGNSIVVGRNTNMNEFNLLSNIEFEKYTIDKNKLNPMSLKVISNKSKQNKYCKLISPNIFKSHNIEKKNQDQFNNIPWKTCIGKKVILVQPSTTWYNKKKLSSQPIENKDINFVNKKKMDSNVIVCSLLLLILLLILIRHHINNKYV